MIEEHPIDKFMRKVFKHKSGCWIWIGSRDVKQYGNFRYEDKIHLAHRWIKEFMHGDLGDKLCLHKCDNPSCVNPDHLYPGTHQDNANDKVNRGRHHNSLKTHCKHGHEFTEENTHYSGSRKHRTCLTCKRISNNKT